MGPLSCRAIIRLIERPMPHNLDELRIVNCHIKPSLVQELLEEIVDSKLRRLALVKLSLGSTLFEYIIKLVSKSNSLIELDISY